MSAPLICDPVKMIFALGPERALRAGLMLSFNLLILLMFCPGLDAAVSIRVAVREGIPSVRISSKTSLRVIDARGRVLYPHKNTSMDIQPVDRGFKVNNYLVKAPFIKIISPQNDLVVGGQPFRGLIEIRKEGKGLTMINELGLEDYLKGVVPEEMAYEWHPEALKVQAIVARTYALYQKFYNQGRKFDLASTILDQVYEGIGRERPETSMAVAQTDGLVVTYGDELAQTYYHSTSAGRTEDIRDVWEKDLPYLRGVDCPFDEASPYYRWERRIPRQLFENSLRQAGLPVGSLKALTPHLWSSAGRVKEVRILHSQGELFLKGEDTRRIIGYKTLPSTQFEVVATAPDIILRGKGYGHGVGLCQWGTKVQAEQGRSFSEIIEYYYPGVQIRDYRALALDRIGSAINSMDHERDSRIRLKNSPHADRGLP